MQVELILLVLSLLFFTSIFTDKIGYKFGIPALLLFLAVGMLFGSDGLGKLINEDSAVEPLRSFFQRSMSLYNFILKIIYLDV